MQAEGAALPAQVAEGFDVGFARRPRKERSGSITRSVRRQEASMYWMRTRRPVGGGATGSSRTLSIAKRNSKNRARVRGWEGVA